MTTPEADVAARARRCWRTVEPYHAPASILRSAFAWSDDDWAAAVERLADRSLVRPWSRRSRPRPSAD